MKKNILFFIGNLGGGGAERVLINLLTHLDRNKYIISLLLQTKEGEYLHHIPEDIKVLTLSWKVGKLNFFYRNKQIFQAIKITKPDLIISFRTGSNIALARTKIFRHLNTKMIFREGTNPSISLTNKIKTNSILLKRLEIRYLYSIANKVISISEGIKGDLIKEFRLKENLIKVIYNPIDLEKFTINETGECSLPWTNDKSKRTIIAIGRLEIPKAYQDLVKAFQLVRLKVPTRLIILGQGPQEAVIKELVKKFDLETDVYMPGFVHNPWDYLACSDLYLSTSHWEGFHLTIVEAMACGVPPVATDCDFGPREIIQDGVNGLLAPVGEIEIIAEKVISILQNEMLRQQLSENALIRAQDFDVNVIVKEYERVFDEVIAI